MYYSSPCFSAEARPHGHGREIGELQFFKATLVTWPFMGFAKTDENFFS